MNKYITVIFVVLILTTLISKSQGLEDIIIEKYHTFNSDVKMDDNSVIPKGSVTYRIYIDLVPGYSLQAIYGDQNHLLRIETTTQFYNDKIWGSDLAENIHDKLLNERKSLAFDSWLTIGSATRSHFGVLKSEDYDGSIIDSKFFSNSDGLLSGEISKDVMFFKLDTDILKGKVDGAKIVSNNGAWAALGGTTGPTEENKILIAQLTTNGELSFELNIQIGTDNCQIVEKYVAKAPTDDEIQFEGLNYGKY